MKIDTSSRPSSISGMENERAKMLAWFDAYKAFDSSAWICCEENNILKDNDLHFYIASNETLQDNQFYMMKAKKLIKSK